MIYRHYKGNCYEVIGLAHVEATLEPVVVYRSMTDGTLWTRPAAEFFGIVTATDGVVSQRFAPLVPPKSA